MSDRGPRGIRVSRALLLPPGPLGDELRPVLDAVDRVHGDGLLTQLVITFEPSLPEASMYRWVRPIGIPWDIAMRPTAGHPRLNLLHEIGHFLDHQAIGIPGIFASPTDSIFERWRSVVQRTAAYAQLLSVTKHARNPRAVEYADYLRQPEELWARCYAQFVAVTGAETDLGVELRQRQHRARRSSIPVQWDDEDFIPVETAIVALFQALGWVR